MTQQLQVKVVSVLACGSVGLFVDSAGMCIPKNVSTPFTSTSTGSSSSSSNTCPLGSNVSVVPVKCFPGFSPVASSTPACGGTSDTFPTTFQCAGEYITTTAHTTTT